MAIVANGPKDNALVGQTTVVHDGRWRGGGSIGDASANMINSVNAFHTRTYLPRNHTLSSVS